MRQRASADAESRAFTDELLAELRAGRWRAGAWWRLLARSARRSWQQAAIRPRAVAELTVLHVLVGALSTCVRRRRVGPGLPWMATSWAMAVSHLGLLGERRSLTAADVITLGRANLPVLAPSARSLPAVVAMASDLLDGRLARATAATSRFGQYADSLADAAFWTWFAVADERSRVLRAATIAACAAPVAVVTVASVACGRMVEPPRPRLLRPSVAMQAVLVVRALSGSGWPSSTTIAARGGT